MDRQELLRDLQDAVGAIDDAGLALLVKSAQTLAKSKPSVRACDLAQIERKP
jgi:hypothetical protein